MGQDPTITLSIKEAGERPNCTYLFHIQLDGKILTSNQSLSLPDSQAVREVSRSFGALFEQDRCRPEMDADAQRALGKQLFDFWLASSWEKITKAVPVGALRFLIIASEIPEILNLPWELLLPPEGDFLGINPLFRIRRFPSTTRQMALFTGELRPRPLRLLFMVCSPSNLATLDYEKEEEALFRAVYGQDVAFDSCDLGTFEELKEKVNEFKPHIVHLTGHGAVGRICPECDALNEASGTCCQKCSASMNEVDPKGHFAFEKEDGSADLVPSEELRRFLSGSGVQCVFVSGCQSGQAPREALAGICQSLVGAEVPLAVGWAASIADDLATKFARTFYRTLKDGQPIDRALLLARQESWKACRERGDPSWTLPVLYSATIQSQIFDPNKPPEVLNRQNKILDALPGMKEGYAEHFVGRRREQQRLLPALRRGELQVVIITGMGGSGKSTLATRLARRLETTNDYIPIPVPSSRENPLSSARLLQAFSDAFRNAARKMRTANASKADELSALAEDLNNPKLSVECRLRDAVAALNESRFLLLLDNFESNQDEADLHILDSEISGFYKYLLESLSGGSRTIITTKYPPSDVPILPPKVHKEDLPDFPESSFLKIMQRDPEVERRSRSGELPMSLLRELYGKFGGTPRFLMQIREAVKEMDAKSLKAELARVELPAEAEPGELQKLRDRYFGDIFTERLYSYFSAESQKALCRSAVYDVPMTLEGLAAVAGKPLESVRAFSQSWQDRAFAYQETEKSKEHLWIVYGLLRGWLLEKLSPEEQKDAHRAAGDFLVEMNQQGRQSELGLSWVDCLMEARSQYLQAEEFELARTVTGNLSNVLVISGFYDGVRKLNEELLNYERYPSCMSEIAGTYLLQGDYDLARIWFKRSIDASAGSNQEEIGFALNGIASIDLKTGDYEAAKENLGKAVKIIQQIGDKAGEAAIWHQLAMIDLKKGDDEAAREKFEKSTKIAQEIGERRIEASNWHNLASIDLRKGDYEAAKKNLVKAMKIRQQIGDRAGEASTWHNLASIDLHKGDYEAAKESIGKAMEIVCQIGDKAGEASAWHNLASIDLHKGDYEAALKNFKKAMKIRQQIWDREGEASTFYQLGILAWNQGHSPEGLRLMALACFMDSSIGHVDAKNDFEALSGMASELKYTQGQTEAMLKEVVEAYKVDRGQSLIDAAFPKG